ncbi:MAG TPA: group II intron reverse transcriptase/maturase [Terriglobales bacterium]
MHENRETCEPSACGSGADRPEKAESRTTGVNGAEESDCAIVPVNQPNKGEPLEGGLSAEAGEGEAWTKENISQTHTNPTQGGNKGVSQGLAGVRQASRERKGERFTALLHHLTRELLRSSFYALKREAAAGVDGVRWAEYEDGLEERLADLHSRVHRGAYRAQPSRRVYIPKADGRQRPLGIAALEDKIVQQAVVTILNEIYENDFLGMSYGFRPGRSQHQALDALTVGITRKRVNWMLDLDIRGFFDNMSHEWTVQFVEHRVGDPRILRLIRKWLKAGVSEDGEWSESKIGTPQGAVISPLLANIYLHYALDLWMVAWRRKVVRGDMIMVRYADDVVLGFEHREEAERFLREVRERLAKFGLELHPEKTRLIEFGRFAASNREKRGKGKPETFDFLGFTHMCGKNGKTGYFVVRRKTVAKRMRAKLQALKAELRRRMHAPIVETGKWLRKVVRGYYQYHAVPGNIASLGVFRERLIRLWRHVLRRRSQKRRLAWDRMGKHFDRWLPHPCLLHPFPHVRFDATHPR